MAFAFMVKQAVVARVVEDVAVQIEGGGTTAIEVQSCFATYSLDQMRQFGNVHADGVAWRAPINSDEEHSFIFCDSYCAARVLGRDEITVACRPIGIMAVL